MGEQSFVQYYDCPILGGVALVKIVRRSFATPDEADEPIYGPVTFGGCENKWDCGVVAKRLPSGGATYDWPKCAAHQTMNSRGRA